MAINSEGYVYALFDTPAGRGTIALLETRGVKFFRLPALVIEKTELDAVQKEMITRLTDFDWVVFPDILAVDYFIEVLKDEGIDPFDLDRVRVLAIGEAVADRLSFSELHADLIASSTDPERVFRELTDYLTGDPSGGLKFLLLRGEQEQFEFREIGRSSELQIYRAMPAKPGVIARFKALFSGGAIDELVISSPVDLLALKFYFPARDLKQSLGDVLISASEMPALTALAEAGLPARMFKL